MAEEEDTEECDESEANDTTDDAACNGSSICRLGRLGSSSHCSPPLIAAGIHNGGYIGGSNVDD